MRQEDKELLIKDLSARILYDVKADGYPWIKSEYVNGLTKYEVNLQGTWVPLESCKLYLRPMSSMAEKERMKIASMANFGNLTKSIQVIEACTPIIDYCYSRHLDIHCLIEKGLALPAPEGLYVEWLQS